MKKLILFLLLIITIQGFGKVTPGKIVRTPGSSISFDEYIPRGTCIFDAVTGKVYFSFLGLGSTKSISTCIINTDIVDLSWWTNFGTTSGTIAQGNDSRINNGQTAYGWGNHYGLYAPIAHVGSTGSAHGNATGSVAGFMTASDFSKLAGIASGATNVTNTNQLTNGAGFITDYTETDPTIYSWAKASIKPSYTYTEVGAASSSTVSFPGFGTSHSTSAYGDHTHSGYISSYPASGIAVSTGSAWGTSITNNSANWNTAYSWGNWASNFGTTAGTIAQGNDSRFHNPITLDVANGLSLAYGQNLSLATATTSAAGAMSAYDKTKLDGMNIEINSYGSAEGSSSHTGNSGWQYITGLDLYKYIAGDNSNPIEVSVTVPFWISSSTQAIEVQLMVNDVESRSYGIQLYSGGTIISFNVVLTSSNSSLVWNDYNTIAVRFKGSNAVHIGGDTRGYGIPTLIYHSLHNYEPPA